LTAVLAFNAPPQDAIQSQTPCTLICNESGFNCQLKNSNGEVVFDEKGGEDLDGLIDAYLDNCAGQVNYENH